jgi:hypothetical protein
MEINGYWWRIEETEEGYVAQSGPHTEFFCFSTSMEEIRRQLEEWY